ncbi:MAG: helix-turn-helix transcriptional regulator [Nitrospiraceae bacterium]|nr:helix-turn-helix transcriptional regulator [Nitrospiraceae bacterium]
MEIKRLIGRRIRDLRKSSGKSQEALAGEMGISPKYLSSIERGKENPTLDTFIKLAGSLDLEISEIFNCTGSKSPRELKLFISGLTRRPDAEKLKLAAKIIKAIYF